MSKKTSKIGEAPPQTPPGVVYIGAELIDDSSSRFDKKKEDTKTSTSKDS